jgi:hypothetical protein
MFQDVPMVRIPSDSIGLTTCVLVRWAGWQSENSDKQVFTPSGCVVHVAVQVTFFNVIFLKVL